MPEKTDGKGSRSPINRKKASPVEARDDVKLARISAGRVVIDSESQAQFVKFRAQLEQRFNLRDPVADFLVEQLAVSLWRLRRSATFEAGLLSWLSHKQTEQYDRSGVAIGDHYFPGDEHGLDSPGRLTNRRTRKALSSKLVGRTLEIAIGKNDLIGRLGRHEAHLMRQVERLLQQLGRLEADSLKTALRNNNSHNFRIGDDKERL